jgi:excisionase family DNA binding protein
MNQEAAYVSTIEAARMLNISVRTAQLWVESGVLTAWKTTGGHRRILLNSVNNVLQEKEKLTAHLTATSKKTVVVVEDDPDLLLLMKMHLSSEHSEWVIHTASDGFEGLMVIGQTRPQIVIADLNMPGIDGFRMIRSIEGCELAPEKLIITTALTKNDVIERGGLPERSIILEKPFSFERLEKELQS